MIIILLLFYVKCGHIYSGGVTITNPIATKAHTFALTFALENGLDADEYIKVQFPFPLHSTSIQANLQTFTSSAVADSGDWDLSQLGEGGQSGVTDLGTASSLYNTDNTYYLLFNQAIKSKTWYILTLYATNLDVQTSGYKYPIKMWSVASLNDNSIIYDENPSFAQIALGSLPSNTISVVTSYTTATLGQSQQVILTITPTVTIGQNTKFLIEIDSSYSFIFIDETTECVITSGCACSISSTTIMTIICSVDLAKLGESTTLTTNIQNSNVLYTAAQSTSISVYSIVGSTYLEYKKLTGQLKLGKLTLSVSLLLLWGIPADTDLVTLYKPAASSKGYPFNSVTVQFTLNSATPSTEQLITITTGDADAVLQSSIAHNLGSGVVCYFRKSVTMIYCKHVQSLQADTKYQISFKCAFTSSASTTQLNFGRVTIKSVVRTTDPYTTYILAGPTGQNVKVQQSEEFTDSTAQGLTNWGYNYVSAGDTSSAFSTAYALGNGRTAGLKLGSQRLIFYLQVSQSQMCPASYSYCGTGQQPELFMKVLFNKNNIKYDNTTITIEQGTACTECTTSLNNYNTDDVYLVMKCSKNYNVCSQLFNGGKGFGFVGNIQSNPSLYPNNQLLDFVVAFYQAPTGSSESMATLVSVQLIHGYVIGQETRTMKASYINYLTSGLGAGSTAGQNKGLLVPTFLRVLGQITSPSSHVGIFVDGSVQKFLVDSHQQDEENDDTGSSTTSQQLCSVDKCIYFGHSGTGTTQTYSDIYTHQKMLLLYNFTGSAQFDMIAGVLNYGVKPESIVVASLSINDVTNGFDVLHAERIFGAAWQISNMASSNTYYKSFGLVFPNSPWDNSANWNSLMASNNVVQNYKVSDVTSIKPGSTVSLTISTSHTDAGNLVSQNSGSLWGAGFLMAGATSFTPTTWSGGSCIKAVSILFCPYDQSAYNEASGTLVGSFIVPALWGAGTIMSTFKYSFSSSSGNMVAFQNEVQSTTGLVSTCTVSDWLNIYPNTKAQEQIVTFNLALTYTLSLGDVFYFQMALSAMPSGLTLDSLCNYQNRTDNLTCTVIGSGTTLKFKSTVTGVSENGTYIMSESLILIFYVSHSGLDTDDQTFTASILNNLNIIEQCSTDGALSFADDALPSLLTVQNFLLENQFYNTKSYMQIQFQINGRTNLQFQSRMQLQLGFMSSTNQILMSSSNSRCLFYEEGGGLNRHWSYIYYDSSNLQLIFELKQLYYSSVQPYIIKCTNIKNPDTSNTEDMKFIWAYYSSTDSSKYTIIQTASISATSLSSQNVNSPTLIKLLNTPGVPAYYIFQYTPTRTNMTSSGRIFIEFSTGQPVFSQQLFCTINDVEVDCSINQRRITLIPQLQQYTRMVPGKQYNITIGQITQPKSIDGFGKIWFAASLDGTTFSEFGYVVDLAVQSSLPTLLPYLSVSFTQFVSRVSKVYLRVNFTAPIRSINIDKAIVLQLGEEFRVPQKSSSVSLECRLYRVGDTSSTNYTSSCGFVKGELITVSMLYDSSNSRSQQSYQLEIRSLTTPDWVSLDALSEYFPSQVQVYITDTSLQSVTYIGPPCFQYLPSSLIFSGQSNQQQFQWYTYNRADGTYSKLIPIVGFTQYPTFTVYKGFVEQDLMLFLGLDSASTQFQRQVNLSITQSVVDIYGSNQVILDMYNYNSDGVDPAELIDPNTEEDATKAKYQISALLSSTITIEIGDYGYYFHLAAKPTIGSGIYYLNFNREITDERVTTSTTVGATTYTTVDFYSKIPTIAIRVDTSHQCPISVSVATAKIPLLGKSQPIYLETSCIPIAPLYIQPIVQSPLTTPSPVLMGMQMVTQFASQNPRSQLNYYFILEASSEGSAGSVVNVTFTISGEASSYFTIDLLQLSIVKNTATTLPYVNATLDANSTSISTNCSKDSTLLWSLSPKGLPSYTFTYGRRYYTNLLTIAANLYDFRLFNFLNPLNQYLQYYQQYTGSVIPSDQNALYSRQVLFGIIGEERRNYMMGISANSNKVIKVTSVEPHMQIQVACLDQYDQISDIVTLDLSSSKISYRNHTLFTLQFQRALSVKQINNLICSIKEHLLLNFHHVTDIACQICNPNLLSYSKKTWDDILSLTETYEDIVNKTLTSATTNTYYYFYLNNYDRDVIKVVTTFLNKITTTNDTTTKIQELGKQITNTTTDPEISYLLRYLAITNYTEGNHDSAQSQVTITANITSTQINVNITNPSKVIVFIGIQKFTSQLDFSAPLNLRRGLTGNGISLEQYVLLQDGESSYTFTVTPYNTTNYKYFLQWSSSPLLANCLSQQYQDTQLLVLEYTAPAQSYSALIFIFTLAMMNY